MLTIHQAIELANQTTRERIQDRLNGRAVRIALSKRTTQQMLQKTIERLLKEEGSPQSVMETLDSVIRKANLQPSART